MPNKFATQGRLVFEALKRRPLTYAGMLELGAGLSPWRRVKEHIKVHAPDHCVIAAASKRDGLVRWRVVKA